MWISEAAEAAGVNVETVRYYERRGLLEQPRRPAAGYRHYSDEVVRILRFIKQAQDLGFTLDEIEELIRLRGTTARDRERARAVAERTLADLQRKIAQLRDIARSFAGISLVIQGWREVHRANREGRFATTDPYQPVVKV